MANNIPIVNIVRREEQVTMLKAIGAQHVLDSNDENFEHDLKYLCHGLNVTIGIDCVSGDLTGIIARAMPANSTVVIYGLLARENISGINMKLLS